MQVPVNQNIDLYKDDFYKGLTLRQTVISVITVCVGILAFSFFYAVLGLSQAASLYLTFPCALPVAAYGFLKIHGMDPMTYLKRKMQVQACPVFYYHPQLLEAAGKEDFFEADEGIQKTDGKAGSGSKLSAAANPGQ